MTTQFILWATLTDNKERIKADKIYKECISIPRVDNLLGRKLIAFYRHWQYSLKREDLEPYVNFVMKQINKQISMV